MADESNLFNVGNTVQADIDVMSILQRVRGMLVSVEIQNAILEATRRLRESARSIGEPLYRLPAMKMTVMSLTVPPLYVLYGVHDDQNVVVVRRIIQI
jgi:hypothetical protein